MPHTRTLLVSLLAILGLGTPRLKSADTPPKRPNLVIMISVDMLSGEIMDRYGTDLPGGLGRLQREGVAFDNAFHDHAFTETGPGHSVLLSGRHPASTGIPENQWRDRETGKLVYCVQDPKVIDFGEPSGKAGSSAIWFKGTTFGTWLKDQAHGRVFAISGKDRASILMAGPKADGVYWFQDGFGFTTSSAYAPALPAWLIDFNRRLMTGLRDRAQVWTPIGPTKGLTYPGRWMAGDTPVISKLPRLIQAPGLAMDAKGGYLLHETQDGSFWRRWRGSPFFDDATFDAAEALITNEHIGEGPNMDLLALGLSATNVIEHAFGNAGPEILDQIRRLDRRLGVFLDRVQVGGRTVAVVFSADHGGLDFPERLQDQGIPAKRLDVDAWMKDLQSKVRKEFHLDQDLLLLGNDHFPNEVYFEPALARQLGDRKGWVPKVVQLIRAMPDVAAAASFSELEALPAHRFEDPRDESILYRLKYSATPERAGEILFAFQPMISLGAPPDHDPAQHGTGWDYDRRVPLIFWGLWKAERRTDAASTVDIAPTLSKELGIQPAEPLDGIPLRLARRD